VLDVTEQEADKILATLDPLAAMAEMDSERITSLLATVQTSSEAVRELLKRTVGDRLWEIVHPANFAEIEISTDRAEALCTKWKVESGQLWQAGPHRIACGDCRDKDLAARLWTAASPSLRMIWSDPPYGVSYSEKTNWLNEHRSGPSRRPIENDSLKPDQLQKLFAMALEVSREHALPGAVIYATVPGAYLKYFIAGLEDGGWFLIRSQAAAPPWSPLISSVASGTPANSTLLMLPFNSKGCRYSDSNRNRCVNHETSCGWDMAKLEQADSGLRRGSASQVCGSRDAPSQKDGAFISRHSRPDHQYRPWTGSANDQDR
jgi:hypothetical protein